jgi:hypothetical protein
MAEVAVFCVCRLSGGTQFHPEYEGSSFSDSSLPVYKPHGVTSQNAATAIFVVTRTPNLLLKFSNQRRKEHNIFGRIHVSCFGVVTFLKRSIVTL